MPYLTSDVITAGMLSRDEQPEVAVGGELRLRPWYANDAELLLSVYADRDIQQWHCRTLTDLDEAREMIDRWQCAWRQETGAHWAITSGRRVVGRAGFRHLDLAYGESELAYWAVPGHRGHGYVPAAVTALTHWAFDIGFLRVFLRHSSANTASCRVAEKTGFRYEGTLVSAAPHPDGRHDMHVHARIANHG